MPTVQLVVAIIDGLYRDLRELSDLTENLQKCVWIVWDTVISPSICKRADLVKFHGKAEIDIGLLDDYIISTLLAEYDCTQLYVLPAKLTLSIGQRPLPSF